MKSLSESRNQDSAKVFINVTQPSIQRLKSQTIVNEVQTANQIQEFNWAIDKQKQKQEFDIALLKAQQKNDLELAKVKAEQEKELELELIKVKQ